MIPGLSDKGMDLFCLVPARGGSKGLPGKNLMEVQGISLVARAILLARKARGIKKVILSTDDENIMLEGKRAGCDVLLKRPPELASSEAPMVNVIEHACNWITNHFRTRGNAFGLIILQPTSPMRRLEHINDAVDLFSRHIQSGEFISGVMSVSPVPDHFYPHRTFRLRGNSFPSAAEILTERLYYRNGAVIILRSDCIAALNRFTPPVIPYPIEEQMISIDSLMDLMAVECCGMVLEPDHDSICW